MKVFHLGIFKFPFPAQLQLQSLLHLIWTWDLSLGITWALEGSVSCKQYSIVVDIAQKQDFSSVCVCVSVEIYFL